MVLFDAVKKEPSASSKLTLPTKSAHQDRFRAATLPDETMKQRSRN
jgi:hypothetical protein